MGVQCADCGGSGSKSEPMEYQEKDKDGHWVTKKGTQIVTCKACGGKGYVG